MTFSESIVMVCPKCNEVPDEATTRKRARPMKIMPEWNRIPSNLEETRRKMAAALFFCYYALVNVSRATRQKKGGWGLRLTLGKLSEGLAPETKYGVFAILFFFLAVFFGLSAGNLAGVAGKTVYGAFSALLGQGFFLLPITSLLLSVSLARHQRPHILLTNALGSALFLCAGLGLLSLLFKDDSGGLLGNAVQGALVRFFDTYISFIFLAALLASSILIIFNTKLPVINLAYFKRKDISPRISLPVLASGGEIGNVGDSAGEEDKKNRSFTFTGAPEKKPNTAARVEQSGLSIGVGKTTRTSGNFTPLPLSLLSGDSGKPGVGDIKANANIIKRTLQNFGIDVEIDEVSVGPSITRYAVKPAEGIRLSRIVALQNELALALAAHPIRIEAPIPGKSLVGIEIPNAQKTIVGLASLISSSEWSESPHPLTVALGRNVAGAPRVANLSRLPHLLVAGATGTGKSVAIHASIVSLLYRNTPEELRFIMIDPKRVELTIYNNIPHLLTPVVTDAKRAILALKWAIKEMERRYAILEAESVRDIHSYHASVVEPAKKKAGSSEEIEGVEAMPYIVIVIDELADIMASYPRELEAAVVRLAQMSRAVGIHLILSTQRPSVDVITGLIKANIPARVALQVASQVDSRTILDMGGAEKLLGAGDLLFLSGEMSRPVRLQAPFISEGEVKKVVQFLTRDSRAREEGGINLESTERNGALAFDLNEDNETGDELYGEAKRIVLESGKASTSYLQRKLKLGYARAARLIDMLEERGVVSPGEGARARTVFGSPRAERDASEDYPSEEE